ncbi:hypothetical protein ACFY1P_08315 [Streptomyces sp. NPDC001407]|uniref:hypothetical protein n=1 Tax=Streptomyces sp. NPDC001407 TaxID=3364573 RepID=UPI0036BBD656
MTTAEIIGLVAELCTFGWGVLALGLGVIKPTGWVACILNIFANLSFFFVGLSLGLAFPVVQGFWSVLWIVTLIREYRTKKAEKA